jgi:hypothetical protein
MEVSSVGACSNSEPDEYGSGNEWSLNPAMLLANHGRKRAGRRIHDSVELRSGACQIEQLMPWRQFQRPVMNTIRLCGNNIDGDAISCTGPQLATLFETIVQTDSLLDRVWYAADVDPAPGQLACYGGKRCASLAG